MSLSAAARLCLKRKNPPKKKLFIFNNGALVCRISDCMYECMYVYMFTYSVITKAEQKADATPQSP